MTTSTTNGFSISFLGAAQNVTGSAHMVEANGLKILIDCGMYQERIFRNRNWEKFPVPPREIDAILLSHAHLDHCGLIPKLVKDGFKGKIYCTPATVEITRIILLDSAHIQEEDAAFKRKRHEREGKKPEFPELPLYNIAEAEACFPLFAGVELETPLDLGKGVIASFHDAGHVLGSAMIQLKIDRHGETRTMIFSGDLGRKDIPILHDPAEFAEADYIIVESTYGNRQLETKDVSEERFIEIINSTAQAGGNLVIPSFALERAQQILYFLNKFLIANRIPHLMVFLDSPMAIDINRVFEQHPECLDTEMSELTRKDQSPFRFPGLKLTRTTEESKVINHVKGTAIIIAGSGMANGGRIKHHLVANISRTESTILFVGYQAIETLGRQILDGAKEVRILGQYYPVRARVEALNGFSAHAGSDEIMDWLSQFKKAPAHVFVVHGEKEASQQLVTTIQDKMQWKASSPEYLDRIPLK